MNTNKTQTEQLTQDAVITRFNFDDLSFSGIVNEIDGDEKTCKDFIIEAYYQIEKQKK